MRAVPGFGGMPSKLDPTNHARFDPRGQAPRPFEGPDTAARRKRSSTAARTRCLGAPPLSHRWFVDRRPRICERRLSAQAPRRSLVDPQYRSAPNPSTGNRSTSQRRGALVARSTHSDVPHIRNRRHLPWGSVLSAESPFGSSRRFASPSPSVPRVSHPLNGLIPKWFRGLVSSHIHP